ncbi:MAG TPA: hypothetical protein VK891_07720 [Euzebyales bacterium]|nr:hypothetical protein [Euzebyales bacterium]
MLAAGAGAVVATAGVLSGRAARHPDLPAQRWTRPLPAAVARMADARATRFALWGLGLAGAIAGIALLAGHDAPVDGLAVLPLVTALALVAGPVLHLVNPLGDTRFVVDGDGQADQEGNDLRGATLWLVALCAIALSTRTPQALAVTATVYLLAQAATTWRLGRHTDALGTLAALLGHLAPVGRGDAGRPVWRNPLVAAAHAALPGGVIPFGAVVIAASLTHALLHPVARVDPAFVGVATPVALFAAVAVAAAGLLGLCVLRPFFRGTIIPLVAAYGLVAAGRWVPPFDLLAFVGLHALAVGVLHRQALARYDLRTARAVQFPLRVALVASVMAGLALLAGP